MMITRRYLTGAVLAGLLLVATSASAQVFGTFSWQMQPYCNVVTMTITQFPGGYTLDGSDNQCGGATLAALTGQALIHPDGTVGINFALITTPAGKAVHVAAVVSPASGSGTWTDSVGNSGTFALAATTPGLPPRPLPPSGLGTAVVTTTEIAPGAVGGTDINTAEVQARVTGTCANGQVMTGINAGGTVVCSPAARVLSAAGMGNNPNASLFASASAVNFVGPTVDITLVAGQAAYMTVFKVMGSTVGAANMHTYPCARLSSLPATTSATALPNLGSGALFHQVTAGTKVDFHQNYTFTTAHLTPGQSYTVGMCVRLQVNGANTGWNDNDFGGISVLVLNAQ